MSNTLGTQKKKFRMIHVYTLLVLMICIAGIMTYIVPAGAFDRVDINGRSGVVPGTFHFIEQQPVDIFGWSGLCGLRRHHRGRLHLRGRYRCLYGDRHLQQGHLQGHEGPWR